MTSAIHISRGLTLGVLLSLFSAGTASAEDGIERARLGFLPQSPAAIQVTTTTQTAPFDVDSVKERYTFQSDAAVTRSVSDQVFPDGIARAREGYVATPTATRAKILERVAGPVDDS